MTANPWLLPGPGRVPDLNIVRQALSLLADPSAGIQLTCMPSWAWGTFPGAGNGIDQAANWVSSHGDAQGIYYALNPVSPELAARCKNSDALRRRWLLIDVDRVKTAENKHLSATAKEHADALALAEEVREHLHGLGWPDPGFHLDSGNGAHLLYRVDWANEPESQKVLSAFLKGLAVHFDGPLGELDRAVHDARRISKLPGTWARKGPASGERPHRMACILSMDAAPGMVSLDLVRQSTPALVQPVEAKAETPARVPEPSRSPWVLVPPMTEETADLAWARRALANECERMHDARPGNLNSQLYKSAAAMGNIVASGLLGRGEVIEAILEAGEAAGCDDPRKDRATVERGLDAGLQTPRRPEPRSATTAPAFDDSGKPKPVLDQPIPIADLVVRFPSLRQPVIDGFLRAGETMNVIASPKTGKSWFVADLAISIATGEPWLGQHQVKKGDVLIVDNELHAETSAWRIPKVGEARGLSLANYGQNLHVKNLRGHLVDLLGLGAFFETMEPGRFQVVVLDAFYRFQPVGTDENGNAAMTGLYNLVDQYAEYLQTSFILIHHSTKGNQSGKGITDMGAGAGSQSRAADTHLILRQHQEPGVIVMEAVTRSWGPPESQCLRWEFPVWNPTTEFDPANLKPERPPRQRQTKNEEEANKPAPTAWTPAMFASAFISQEPKAKTTVIFEAIEFSTNSTEVEKLSKRAAEALLAVCLDRKLAYQLTAGRRTPALISTLPIEQSTIHGGTP